MTAMQSLPGHGAVFAGWFDDVRDGGRALRDGGRALRAAWHPDEDLLVLSMWRNGRCVATSQLTRADVGGLIGDLGMALATGPSTSWTTPRLASARRPWPRRRRRVVAA